MTRLSTILPGIVLVGVSLLLFTYVGYAEATRVFVDMRIERLFQLGATIQHPINTFAKSGLPLDQVSAFERRAAQLAEVDDAIHAVALWETTGRVVSCYAVPGEDPQKACAPQATAPDDDFLPHYRVEGSGLVAIGDSVILRLPVRDKFGLVGHVILHVDEPTMQAPVDAAFRPVVAIAGALFVVFVLVQLAVARAGPQVFRQWLTPTFAVVMLSIVAVLVTVMFSLYRQGTEGQAEALARSMAARLAAVTALGIPIDVLTGVREALDDYRVINPKIAAITLIEDGKVLYRLGDREGPDPNTLAFSQQVDPKGTLYLTTELPISVVLNALAAGGRNFLALFFGCILFSSIFFRAVRARSAGEAPDRQDQGETGLAVLQPAYFLGILADALVLSVVPEISVERVTEQGLSASLVSLPLSLFFIGLTFALIPASFMTERFDLRRLFMAGCAAVAAGLIIGGLFESFWALCVGRLIAGVGQGLLLITVQAYAFELVGPQHRVKAAAAQVLGYNGALIVGTGIGGLMAVFMDDAIFMVMAGFVALAAVAYTRLALQSLRKEHDPQPVQLFTDLRRVLVFPDFLALLGLVGATSKFALAGVVIFAMPLVLYHAGYDDDEVGQALMVFAVVTYFVTAAAPRLVAALGSTDRVLVLGMIALAFGMSGLGLVTVETDAGASALVPDWLTAFAHGIQAQLAAGPFPAATGVAIVVSVALLGTGQGMIAAPIIARVAAGGAAHAVGRDRTIAVYRILERVGHISGPAIVGLLLVSAAGNPVALVVLGGAFLVLGVLYGAAGSAFRQHADTP